MNYYKKQTRCSLTAMLVTALIAFIGITMPGCATVGNVGGIVADNPIASKAVIQIATVRYIDGDAARAASVLEHLDYVEFITGGDGTAYTVEHVTQSLKNEIDWAQLTPTETVLVLNLIDGVSAYVSAQLADRDTTLIDAQSLVTVTQAVGWIREAASITRAELSQPLTTSSVNDPIDLSLWGYLTSAETRAWCRDYYAYRDGVPIDEQYAMTAESYDAAIAADHRNRATKLNALMIATDPDTGNVDHNTYLALTK